MIVRKRLRLGLRERIWIAVVGSIAVLAVGLTGGFNAVVADRLNQEANSIGTARASAELDSLRVTRTGVRPAETFDTGAVDAVTWVFQGDRVLEHPRTTRIGERIASGLTRAPRGFVDVPGSDTRLYGLPIASHSRRVGTVVAAVALGPYERIKRVALVGSCLLALVVVLAVTLAARWLIWRSLRPVSEMTLQAAEWSEHDLERRFSLGEPRDEFTRLAATLDGLLDRVATSLRHEQQLTAELSHELRTPLTQISTEAQFALRHGGGAEEQQQGYRRILASASHMTRILDTLMSAARANAAPGHVSSDATETAKATVEAWQPVAREQGVEIGLRVPNHQVPVAVDADVLERALAPLLENACRYANDTVTVCVAPNGSAVHVEVVDDGPGIPDDDLESVFTPSHRKGNGAGPIRPANGAGLGLPLARRLARGVGGEVRAASHEPGAKFIVTVPRG